MAEAEPSASGLPPPSSAAPLEWEDEEPSERQVNAFVLVFLAVLAFSMILSHQMGHKFKFKYLAEAGAVVLVGALMGGIIMLSSHGHAQEWLSKSISPTIFFIGFLPPIIYNSGYNLKRKVFLYYFVPSILYAVVGTIITSLFVGLCLYGLGKTPASYPLSLGEALAFGSLITSTDTVCILAIFERQQVEPLLFYLVFGESVFNDAVVLVLYRIFTSWIGQEIMWGSMGAAIGEFFLCFIGSMGIGFIFGCAAALLYKHIDLRHSVYEMGIYLLLAYIPYVFSEMITLSGIVTILFTGMFSRHYSHPNLSVDGQSRALFLFHLLSVLAETAIFLQLGLTVFSTQVKYVKPLFIFWSFLLIMVGRALNVYPISWVVNRYTNIKVSPKIQHMIWYAGIRGAMAFACAKGFPDTNHNQDVVVATTMMIVLITLFGFGTTTIPMLEHLGIPVGVPADDAVSLSDSQTWLLRVEEKYLKPFLTRPLALHAGDGEAHPPTDSHAGSGSRGQSSPFPDMRGRSTSGSIFLQNDYIDSLFHLNSIAYEVGGAGSAVSSGGRRRPTFAAMDDSGSGSRFRGGSISDRPASANPRGPPTGSPLTQQQQHVARSTSVAAAGERGDEGESTANVI